MSAPRPRICQNKGIAKPASVPAAASFRDPAGSVFTLGDLQDFGIYRGVTFHSRFFDDKPADFSHEDYKYEISIATDYAINFGRGRFCARVPVTRAQMVRMMPRSSGLG